MSPHGFAVALGRIETRADILLESHLTHEPNVRLRKHHAIEAVAPVCPPRVLPDDRAQLLVPMEMLGLSIAQAGDRITFSGFSLTSPPAH